MKIYSRKYGKEGIPIVPMLDVLTILIIFFIVNTEFKQQVSVLNLDVPQTQSIAGVKGDKESVLLEIASNGQLALGGKLLNIDELGERIKELKASNPDVSIQLSSAQEAAMGKLIEVMDKLTAAGLDMDSLPVRIDYKGK